MTPKWWAVAYFALMVALFLVGNMVAGGVP